MIIVVLTFLALSISLYVTLAGADFGAGILESVVKPEEGSKEADLISHAIAPVWEANHIWSILAVVIIFTAFPAVFSEVCISFHIPLVVMLIGITLRGCAFAFRHYDEGKPDLTEEYTWTFRLGSWITPFSQGVIAGGAMLGRVNPAAPNFYARYINPWCNLFSFSVGLLFCAVCAFLASAYLVGDSDESALRHDFRRRSRILMWISLFVGASVFIAADLSGLPLIPLFFVHPLGSIVLLLALVLAVLSSVLRLSSMKLRFIAATFATSIVFGWFAVLYPDLLVAAPVSGADFNIFTVAAAEATLRQLVIALVIGAALIIPSLGYLFFTFKRPEQAEGPPKAFH